MLSRTGDVRVVRTVPRAVEEAIRIAALGGAVMHEVVHRFEAGGNDIGVA
jgi:hypothetical protein